MSALEEQKLSAEEVDSDEEDNVKATEEKVEEAKPEEDTSLNNPDVVTKYQEAAKIANFVVAEVAKKCVVGANLLEICRFGDELIEEKVSTIFKAKNKSTGKVVLKGVAFPVCVSVNEIICHVSPLESDDTYEALKIGDMCKIDLGVHIDGFIAVVAHTVVVGFSPEVNTGCPPLAATPATVDGVELMSPARMQVLTAAYVAAELAAKSIKPGNNNAQVTQIIKQVGDAYGVKAIAGTLMHQMKQFVVDGNKMILLRDDPDTQKVDSCTFEVGEVYCLDIAFSTGEGRPMEADKRTTVHKRAVEVKYALKNKSSRSFFNDVNKRFPTLPFSTRCFADEKAAKLGVRECVLHNLLLPYPVLTEKKGEEVAHVKFTVLVLPSGSMMVTGLPPLPLAYYCTPTTITAAASTTPVEGELTAESLAAAPSKGFLLAEVFTQKVAPLLSAKSEGDAATTGLGQLPAEAAGLLAQPTRTESKKKAKKSAKKASSTAAAAASGTTTNA